MSSAETSEGIAAGRAAERFTASRLPGAVSSIESSDRHQIKRQAPGPGAPGEDALRRLVRVAASALEAPAAAVALLATYVPA